MRRLKKKIRVSCSNIEAFGGRFATRIKAHLEAHPWRTTGRWKIAQNRGLGEASEDITCYGREQTRVQDKEHFLLTGIL